MKVVVITGVSSGIGKSLAQHFIAHNHQVYGLSRSKIELKGLQHIKADVTDYAQITQVFQEVMEKEGRIDILINNAGMGISGSIEDTSIEDANYIFQVNMMGVFHSVKAVLPHMRANHFGKIINIGSVAGVLSIPFQGFYSASKAAVLSFSDALANEVSPFGVQVCTILPGDIKTDFTKNRKKNIQEQDVYKTRVHHSLLVMEKDEQAGMSSEYAARVIYRTTMRKKVPLIKTVGPKYKVFVFLKRIVPYKWANQLVGSIYAFKKK